ncbi:MAG: DUF2283 domain-containing protein [Chloroflexota bacterium]|nr:DUF2283 domain-containing protein [Chloroflexota bacterium]
MKITYSPTAGALYLSFRSGPVAETVEIADMVLVDLDEAGEPLGVESVHAEDFLPFLVRHAGEIDFPAGISALVNERAVG